MKGLTLPSDGRRSKAQVPEILMSRTQKRERSRGTTLTE